MDITAIIMAGGKGSRLMPFTYAKPKPLIEIEGRPLIDHVLANIAKAGFKEATIVVNHMADMIVDAVGTRSNGMDVHYHFEDKPLGTAGSIPRIKGEWLTALVSNADLVTDADLGAMVAAHNNAGAMFTMAVRKVNHSVPYGVVSTCPDGRFLGLQEKLESTYLANAGMYVVDKPAFKGLTGRFDMTDVLARQEPGDVGLFHVEGVWRDIGRKEDLPKDYTGDSE